MGLATTTVWPPQRCSISPVCPTRSSRFTPSRRSRSPPRPATVGRATALHFAAAAVRRAVRVVDPDAPTGQREPELPVACRAPRPPDLRARAREVAVNRGRVTMRAASAQLDECCPRRGSGEEYRRSSLSYFGAHSARSGTGLGSCSARRGAALMPIDAKKTCPEVSAHTRWVNFRTPGSSKMLVTSTRAGWHDDAPGRAPLLGGTGRADQGHPRRSVATQRIFPMGRSDLWSTGNRGSGSPTPGGL